MKKTGFILALAAVLCAGCGIQKLPFQIEDVKSIEVYRFEGVPAAAEKKVVTEENEVEEVYRKLQAAGKPQQARTAGGTVISFRVKLKDGDLYERIYTAGLEPLEDMWEEISAAAVAAEEIELPSDTNHSQEPAMKAMVLRDPSGDLYFVDEKGGLFTASLPETIAGPDGESLSPEELEAGDTVELYGDGIMLESYPGQYQGVTKAVRIREGTEADAEPYRRLLEEIYTEPDPSEIPSMNLEYTEGELVTSAVLTSGNYEWTYVDENGEGHGVVACGAHILEWKDLTEIRLEGPADLKLLPSREMESAEVLRWPASARDLKDIAQAGPGAAAEVVRQEGEWVIPGAEPGYVYLVTGNWPEGYVEFGFLTE